MPCGNARGVVTREVVANGHPVHEYQWPGVYFEARFDGPAVSFSVDDDQNVLHVLVDGELLLVLPRAGYRDVTLADLGDGAHTIRVEKTSETQGSTARFLGFSVPDAGRRRAPPDYTRAIEFIGDSFTVGYGDTSTGTECSGTQVRDTTNTSLAFGPLTAKHFASDYRILASSGFGMVRNYANKEPGTTMPVLYHRALSGEPDAAWQPDAIVIWLGTNDFSTAVGEDERWQDPAGLRDDYRARGDRPARRRADVPGEPRPPFGRGSRGGRAPAHRVAGKVSGIRKLTVTGGSRVESGPSSPVPGESTRAATRRRCGFFLMY
ncbi:MAG: SGNH/GDSL hydrolase family protein [Woeseiaceae bacterium]